MHLSKLLASLGLDKCRTQQVLLIEMSAWCNTHRIPMQLGQWRLNMAILETCNIRRASIARSASGLLLRNPPYPETFTETQANVLHDPVIHPTGAAPRQLLTNCLILSPPDDDQHPQGKRQLASSCHVP